MTIKVRYYFTVDPNFTEVVTNRLKTYGVEIESYQNDLTHLIGTIHVLTEHPLKMIDQMNVYYQIEGILKISADYDTETDKRLWYKHPIFPMLISAGLTAVTIYGILYGLNLSQSPVDYLVLIGIPAVVSFFTGILHKFY